jgi:hypothetical protein
MAYKTKCPECDHEFEIDLSTGPRPGGVTAAVYEWVKTNPSGSRTDVLKWGMSLGYNPSTVLTQYAAARRKYFPKE